MKKTNLFMLVVFLSVGLTAGASHAQTTPAGPRIVHEEERITVFEDGKEVEKHYVGKQSVQERTILKDARDKKRSIKKVDVQHPKLKFYDAHNKLIKEIDLASEKRKGRIKETRPRWVKGEYDADIETVRRPLVSKQNSFAVMDNSTYFSRASRGEGVIETGKIILYDVAGNVLYEKQFPYGSAVSEMAVADNGTVAVKTYESGVEGGGEPQILQVYDKTGKELLIYPKEGEKAYVYEILKISSNGRYLAVRVAFKDDRTVFFDLEKKATWIADRSYVVYEISDEGIATADYYDETIMKRSGTAYIDLATRMKP